MGKKQGIMIVDYVDDPGYPVIKTDFIDGRKVHIVHGEDLERSLINSFQELISRPGVWDKLNESLEHNLPFLKSKKQTTYIPNQ